MVTEPLSEEELTCLRRLSGAPGAQLPCTKALLEKLVRKGLVERQPRTSLPVQPQTSGYSLTPAGKQALTAK